MKIAKKREAGEILGRSGIAQRIVSLSKNISEGNYKNAIEKGGQISELIAACSGDSYWDEKAWYGKQEEQFIFKSLINKTMTVDQAITRIKK